MSWIRERRRKMDEEAIESADEMSDQSDEEREYTGQAVDDIAADRAAARIMGTTSMDDIERLGDR